MAAAITLLLPEVEYIADLSIEMRALWLAGLISLGAAVYFTTGLICGIRKADLRVNEEL